MPYVRPDVQNILNLLAAQPGPQLHEGDPATGRQAMLAMGSLLERPRGDIAEVRDLTVPGDHSHRLPARLYRPTTGAVPGPVLVYYHGGGWVIGDLDTHDPLCAEIALQLGMTVVSIDYRLAPEAPFPAATEDCLAATRWIAGSPAEIGHAVTGLIVAGDSAGGNLAAVVAHDLAGGTGGAPIVAQWLIYPATDMTAAEGSMVEFSQGYLLTAEAMRWFMGHYMGETPDLLHPWASPLHAESVAGVAPALVFTCGLDPLRDQGRAYAARLVSEGVRTIYREAEGQIHGCFNIRQGIPSAQDDLTGCIGDLKRLLAEAQALPQAAE